MNDAFAREMREAVSSALPEGAFLRRDRGDALYVTDAPRRGVNVDWDGLGFICRTENGLARLTPGSKWLRLLEERYPEPPNHLCATLKRFAGEPDQEVLKLFSTGMKLLDGGPFDPSYERRLRQQAAVALRTHHGGGLYACGIILHLVQFRR